MTTEAQKKDNFPTELLFVNQYYADPAVRIE